MKDAGPHAYPLFIHGGFLSVIKKQRAANQFEIGEVRNEMYDTHLYNGEMLKDGKPRARGKGRLVANDGTAIVEGFFDGNALFCK